MGFKCSLVDNDFWMKEDLKLDGTPYYSYLIVYVDNILIISHYPHRYMVQLQTAYFFNPSSIMVPKLYLGSEIK